MPTQIWWDIQVRYQLNDSSIKLKPWIMFGASALDSITLFGGTAIVTATMAECMIDEQAT